MLSAIMVEGRDKEGHSVRGSEMKMVITHQVLLSWHCVTKYPNLTHQCSSVAVDNLPVKMIVTNHCVCASI